MGLRNLGPALALVIASPVLAHDLWIVPGKFVIEPGDRVRVFINSGDDFPVSDALVSAARVESLTFDSASTDKSAITDFAVDGKSLTVEITSTEPGAAVLALALKPRLIRLKPAEFNDYLVSEGLPQLIKLREALGEAEEPAVERYTKWAKAILTVGEGQEDWVREPTGLGMEIVPQASTNSLRPGSTLPFKVFLFGKALSDVNIVGARAGTPAHRVRTVTDAHGEARVVLEEAGRWYLRALHVIRLQDDPEADWESYWATITFEVGT